MIYSPWHSFSCSECKTKFIKWNVPLYDVLSAAQFFPFRMPSKIHKAELCIFVVVSAAQLLPLKMYTEVEKSRIHHLCLPWEQEVVETATALPGSCSSSFRFSGGASKAQGLLPHMYICPSL